METKDITEIVENGLKETTTKWNDKLQAKADEIVETIEKKGFSTKEQVEEEFKEMKSIFQDQFDELAKVTREKSKPKVVNFKDAIGTALSNGKDGIESLKNKSTKSASIQLKDENMNFTNFANDSYSEITTDRSRGMYMEPFAPLWLRNVLPNTSTSEKSIYYLQENGGTGAAGVWDGSGAIDTLEAKPGVNYDFTDVTENVQWIAGITRIKREMLDDVAWLQSYISRQLTVGKRGLWVAENTIIYNKLEASSTAYDGDNTVPVEMIYDAAFGQLKDNYHNPTTILMNHRDVVNLIALNKAEGNGMYNLPAGTVSVIGNQLILGGVPVLGVPNIPVGEFIVFDRNATEFVSRMQPEVRFSEEDRDNFIKNLITVRAEERMAVLVYDTTAIVSGSFAATT